MTSPVMPAPPVVHSWVPQRARIEAVRPECSGVVTYTLSLPDAGPRFAFRPGQFNMLYLPGIGESAISLSSDPEETGALQHTVRAAGNVTQALSSKKVGDVIGLRGPFGTGWPVEAARGQDLIIACGGISDP